MTVLDLRGHECPKPVLRALRVIATSGEREFMVLVDSQDCAETLKYMVESLDVGRAEYSRERDHYIVRISKL